MSCIAGSSPPPLPSLGPALPTTILHLHTLFLSGTVFHSSWPQTTEALYPSSISANGWSWNWYMALTPFEAVFLNLIMLEIAVLRYIEILPININNLFYGDPSGRRRRRRRRSDSSFLPAASNLCGGPSHDPNNTTRTNDDIEMLDAMFGVIDKLDRQQCLQRTLCHLKSSVGDRPLLPDSLSNLLNLLIKMPLPGTGAATSSSSSHCAPHIATVVESIRHALEIGRRRRRREVSGESHNGHNTTTIAVDTCESEFALCPISAEDARFYLNKLNSVYE